jgi:type II secretory pathway component PulF
VRVWTAFKKTRSFNKKVLHMVFGVSETGKAEEEMRKLAQEYP